MSATRMLACGMLTCLVGHAKLGIVTTLVTDHFRTIVRPASLERVMRVALN